MSSGAEDIAIVGMAALFPGAANLEQYWENILNGVHAVTDGGDAWSGPLYEAGGNDPHRMYTRRGGFLKNLLKFDPLAHQVPPSSVAGARADQFVALRVAAEALADAGFGRGKEVPRERTGIVVGHSAHVEASGVSTVQHSVFVEQTIGILARIFPDEPSETWRGLREALVRDLPPYGREPLVGQVTNLVAGLVANRLDLRGPNFVVDGACASSLLAVDAAMRELRDHRCDVMLAGGVQASLASVIYLLFCSLGALARDRVLPFDENAAGTLLGEGAGLLVLKRLGDALRDGDRIYAVLKAVGVASDGKAHGILTPRLEGEALAIRRAWDAAGLSPKSAELIEAHGTGIPLGDEIEMRALREAWGAREGALPSCGITAVKSMIGHCLAASGAAGLIKMALALHRRVMPPMLCGKVRRALEIEKTPFFIATQAVPWLHDPEGGPRRAAVNAFGFGGINSHAILEEAPRGPHDPVPLTWTWPVELYICSGSSAADLAARAERAAAEAEANGAELRGLALRAAREDAGGPERLAVVAASAADLAAKLRASAEALRKGRTPTRPLPGVCHGCRDLSGRVAFLLPGHGSQHAGMLRDLYLFFDEVRPAMDKLEGAWRRMGHQARIVLYPPDNGIDEAAKREAASAFGRVDVGFSLVLAGNMAVCDLLAAFGVKPDAVAGHSVGEMSAVVPSGAWDSSVRDPGAEAEVLGGVLWAIASRELETPVGLLAVGGLDAGRLRALAARWSEKADVAMENCPNQTVFCAVPEVLAGIQAEAAQEGGICMRLPVQGGFHTRHFSASDAEIRRLLESIPLRRPSVPWYSGVTGGRFPEDPAAIRELLGAQWKSRVRFTEVLEAMYRDGFRLFVEAGPGSNLTSFVNDTLGDRDVVSASTSHPARPGLEHFLGLLGILYAHRIPVRLERLWAGREDRAVEGTGAAMTLSLGLPFVRIDDAWVDRLRQRPVRAEAVQDSREAAMVRHFALMREFLDQQARVVAMAAGGEGGLARPAGLLVRRVLSRGPDGLAAEVVLDAARESILLDHQILKSHSIFRARPGGLPVVPMLMSVEMAAEAAALWAGPGQRAVAVSEIEALRWMALDDGTLRVRIDVSGMANGRARIELRAETIPGGQEEVCFRALVETGAARRPRRKSEPWARDGLRPPELADADIYRHRMFHGPSFQGVRSITAVGDSALAGVVEILPITGLGGGGAPELDFLLADALTQMVGFWRQEVDRDWRLLLPLGVERLEMFGPDPKPGALLEARMLLRNQTRDESITDLEALDGEGCSVMRLAGLRQRYFGVEHEGAAFMADPVGRSLCGRRRGPDGAERFKAPALASQRWALDSGAIFLRSVARQTLAEPERSAWVEVLRREGVGGGAEWLARRLMVKDAARFGLERRTGKLAAPADILAEETGAGLWRARCDAPVSWPVVEVVVEAGEAFVGRMHD